MGRRELHDDWFRSLKPKKASLLYFDQPTQVARCGMPALRLRYAEMEK